MNKVTRILLALALVVILALAVVPPAQAAGPTDKVPAGKKETLGAGWERVNQYAKRHVTGLVPITEKKNGKDVTTVMAQYETVISALPQVTADGSAIDTKWYALTDIAGQKWFETGTNTLKAKVQDGKVYVEDQGGRLTSWDSQIIVGGASFSGGTATIADDPINPLYKGNALKWSYGSYSTTSGGKAVITRYLRVVEGYISELWYLPEEPASLALINLNKSTETKFTAKTNWMNAWDSEGRSVPVSQMPNGQYRIDPTSFKGLTYPVWIDPTLDFTTSASDGFAYTDDAVYATARTAASADWVTSTTPGLSVGQDSGPFYVARSYLYFNTASIPDTATISGSYLYLQLAADFSTTDFNIFVQNGMPTYPRDPLIAADYNYSLYSGNGGQINTSGMVTWAYNVLTLTATGISWVNKTGYTKFMLRSDRDFYANTPSGMEFVSICGYEYGAGSEPQLRVVYTVPIASPTVTTMDALDSGYTSVTFRGYLTDDGGEACATRFKYDVSTAYGLVTAWQSGYVTGDYFTSIKDGLTPGTLYYFKAEADNSAAGTALGSGITALTNPYPATSVTATAGNAQVVLNWTKGTGAQKTMIRRATTGYPNTPTDGTQAYFNTGATVTDTPLVNGTTYYYSIWSYTTSGGLEEYSLDRTTVSATPAAPALASVTTDPATSVTAAAANINLSLTSLGGYGSADVSFQWATHAYYIANGNTYNQTTAPVTATSLGTLSEPLAGLAGATQYHFQARVQNPSGWAYGVDRTFTTGSNSAAAMTTNAATNVELFSAQMNGTVTGDGGAPPVEVWFEYGLTTAYGSSTPSASGLSTGSTFFYGLSGLTESTQYHYRAVGQNSVGVSYGADAIFTTDNPATPTVETVGSTGVGTHQATLQGQVLTDGGVDVEVAFEYGTTGAYGTTTDWVGGKYAGNAFSALISNLTLGQTYHFRAKARNATGTGNGSDATFTSVFTGPTGFTAKAVSSATINLAWTKQGDITCIRYATDGYPITRDSGTQAYYGDGSYGSVSGLTAGTTYYFRAWTGAEGDTWASTTAEAIATTPPTPYAGQAAATPTIISGISSTDVPTQMFATPTKSKLASFPGYAALEQARASYQMPEWSFYLIGSLLITMLVMVAGIMAGMWANSRFGTQSNVISVGLVFGVIAIIIFTVLGTMPYAVTIPLVLLVAVAMYLLNKRQEA